MSTDALLTETPMPAGRLGRWLRQTFRASSWKQPVRVATTANITLSGTQTIDGVALAAKDRVLVKDQSTASGNGIYVVMHGTWLRALDADHVDKLPAGTKVTVQAGTTNGGTTWRLTTTGTIVLGSSSLAWTADGGSGGTLAGDVSGSIGSNTIAARAVTYAKIQAVTTARLLGRTTAGSGDVEELSASAVKTFLAIVAADISDFVTTVRAQRLDQMATPTATTSMGSQRVSNVGAGTFPADAARMLDTYASTRAAKTADYTFATTDAGATIELTGATGRTFTVPPQSSVSWQANTMIRVANTSSGTLTIAAGSGVTIVAVGGTLTLPTQNSYGLLWQRSNDQWLFVPLSGNDQPLDADLTAIAALSTTSFGRSLLTLADAAAGRTALGLGTLALASTIASADITDGTIVDGDIDASAAIALSKLATIANNRVLGNVSGGTAVPTVLTASDLSTMLSLSATYPTFDEAIFESQVFS